MGFIMKDYDKDDKIQIRLSKEQKEVIVRLSEELEETYTDTIIKSVDLRNKLLQYIIENELDDENQEQFKDIVLIIVKNLKICNNQ